ncbi:penicillin-binding protein 2 [Propioniciclava coleopterorum]|uniref:Penicillin-binding protein 2 n=1 Tax=Propioniciclava coleopterorum TaxID=2714937 RepID=A0A6G7Y818_9ACTN|nr:penicillin-binding protein 2 [Propioniciclava coleopterorum]
MSRDEPTRRPRGDASGRGSSSGRRPEQGGKQASSSRSGQAATGRGRQGTGRERPAGAGRGEQPTARSGARQAPRSAASRPGTSRAATSRTAAGRPSTRRPGGRRPGRKPASTTFRLRILIMLIAVVFSFVGARAVQIQVFNGKETAAQAATKMTVARDVPAVRGTITGRDGQVMALTESTVNVIADPKAISTNGREAEAMSAKDRERAAVLPAEMAAIIAPRLGLDAAEVEAKLRRSDSRYQVLAKQVPSSTWVDLSASLSKYPGITRESNPRRIYPMGTVGSNVVGFMSEGKGVAGLERSQDPSLTGTPGREIFETSPMGKIPLGNQVLTPAVDGTDLQLTLDPDMQMMVEQRLAARVQEVSGNWGVAIVMDVETGELLSLANYPSFDPNDPGKAKPGDTGNRAVNAVYEPGSVQKVLTLASLLDAGLTTPDTEYRIDGTIDVGTHTVNDSFRHGPIDITTRGILVRSSNVGAITAARDMDSDTLRDYMLKFGLGTKTNLGLPGELGGTVPGANMPQFQADSMAFGYGVSVSAVQMAAAVAAVANGASTPSRRSSAPPAPTAP